MKKINRFLICLTFLLLLLPINTKASSNQVNVYLFYGSTCPHCKAEKEVLEELKDKYPNLNIYKYEVWGSSKNRNKMNAVANKMNVTVTGVPFTIIGTKTYIGFSNTSGKSEFEKVIKAYSKVAEYKDPAGKILGVTNSNSNLTYEDIVSADKNGSDYIIDVPFIGAVESKSLSLPLLSIIIGTIDGFNPCAMWVLLFLISILIGMKDKKRMWALGSAFMITSAVIYLVFMLAWLNLAIFIGAIWWIKILIALVAFAGGIINVRAYIRSKEAGCEVVDEKKRKKIFAKVKSFTSEKSFVLALLGIITLAVSVNFIELTCSAGLPVIFTNILALNNLSAFEYSIYIFLYLLFFLLDDLIVFFIAMTTLKMKGISNKYAKYSHLIGGIIMLIIGILMVFKPEWLMFNF
jgi:thiol-disulfide isomerase/thioredoxin